MGSAAVTIKLCGPATDTCERQLVEGGWCSEKVKTIFKCSSFVPREANFHCRNMSLACFANTGWPLRISTVETFQSGLTCSRRLTAPEIRVCLASTGWYGITY